MISQTLLSLKKTRAIQKVVKLTLNPADESERMDAYRDLYNILKQFPFINELLTSFDFSLDDLYRYSIKLEALGFTDAQQDWPYISIFCFGPSLAYFLENREYFDSLSGAGFIYLFVQDVLRFM